jgi:hypothetical protein
MKKGTQGDVIVIDDYFKQDNIEEHRQQVEDVWDNFVLLNIHCEMNETDIVKGTA